MRVPLSWLGDYVSLDGIEILELEHRLSMTGTKVEAVHRPGGEVENIVVAEVLAIEAHPNADNLSMVEISTGDGVAGRVVCGAKNFSVGDRVPYAAVGSKLPGVTIEARKIRGEVSKGMLCSGAELGISKDASGLLILQPDAPLGTDVVSLLGLDDVILELEVTPNRPDCMSMIGVAREVSAIYERELRIPETTPATDDLVSVVSVKIQDDQGCPRYLARYIEGVTVGPSPAWLASRLLAAGIRPISNVVDATNYALLETGQPMHAFDAATIAGSEIAVRRARPKEKLLTLDGVVRELEDNDLVIADAERAIALAGVMGGSDTEVSGSTGAVVLECAAFDRVSVAFTSRRQGLRTEASARFERGTDIEGIPYAAARCSHFIKETAGGSVSPDERDAYPVVHERPWIVLRSKRTHDILGIDIPTERQARHLASIGIRSNVAGDSIEAEIPGFRVDLVREVDLIEEVARLEGYNELASTVPSGPAGALTTRQRAVRTITRTLVSQGMTEAWTSSFFPVSDLDTLGLDADHPARRVVEVANPMVEQEAALRSTMLPGLLRSVARNHAQQVRGVGLFEVAKIYEPTTEDLADEQEVLGAAMSGYRLPPSWHGAGRRWDLFAAKGVLQAALDALAVGGLGFEAIAGHTAPFHPGRGAVVHLGRETIGVLGELHPEICDAFELPEGTVAFEIALGPVFASLPERREAVALPRFPSLTIDLAVVVDEGIAASRVQDLIEKAGAPEVVRVELFDLYSGEQIADGKKSLAFSLELRDPDRTLTESDATRARERIVNALAERLGAELRG